MEKTTDPVFEETLHFLVRNPLTDTLLVKLMDRKTSLELGAMKKPLDLVFGRPGMSLEKQNFTLNTRTEAKVVLDMSIRVLKHGGHSLDDDDLDEEIKLPDDPITAGESGGGGDDNKSVGGHSRAGSIKAPPGSSTGSPQLARSGSTRQPVVAEEVFTRTEESRPLLAALPVEDDKNMKIRLSIRYRSFADFLWGEVRQAS